MCLAVPGRVLEVELDAGLRVATVEFGGGEDGERGAVRRRVCLETLPDAGRGDWILVHAGFALQILDERAAEEVCGWLADAAAQAQERPGATATGGARRPGPGGGA